ncbi:MAG: hypothetical protein ACJ8BW_08750 [Ktedonobacteraceae bacterium]
MIKAGQAAPMVTIVDEYSTLAHVFSQLDKRGNRYRDTGTQPPAEAAAGGLNRMIRSGGKRRAK